MKISNEAKVGALVISTLAILLFGYNYLKGNKVFSKRNVYHSIYTRVDGLNVSNPIQINGFSVGRVSKMELRKDNSGLIDVELEVDKEYLIPRGTVAKIVSVDLLGEKAVQLLFSEQSEFYQPGDTLVSDVQTDLSEAVRIELLPVKVKAESLLGSIDSLIGVVQVLLNKGKIDNSLLSIEKATSNFADAAEELKLLVRAQAQNLDAILSNMASITGNLDNSKEDISRLLANLASITDSLNNSNLQKAIAGASEALSEAATMLEKINNAEGSVGLLINDRQFYDNLLAVTASLDSLLVDLQENPGRYVHLSFLKIGSGEKKEQRKNN